ncbi:MAG TPA: type II restriction endonuclease [Octadecabacter sp.]|nr:type II restriction endonuclease [Octadecabacter sp.]
MELSDWLDEHAEGWFWYVKRLSGNDTLANGSHQAGFYIPKGVFFRLFPSLEQHTHENADSWFDLTIDSHPDARNVRVVWYNNKARGGTRDEVRVTNLGGGNSALLDPESTGALAVFTFLHGATGDVDTCNVWVCRNEVEEDIVERETGPVEPGRWTTWPPDGGLLALLQTAARADCRLEQHELPPEWLKKFPTGQEIINKVIELRPDSALAVDKRLVRRRDCEFELFQSLEEAVELPRAKAGFATIADFLAAAQTVLQRRKARSGKSLELHMREILIEENFDENKDFTYQPKAGNNPDFLFPTEAAYLDAAFPRERVRMLAVKTTFKDRWRQVTEECADLPVRHLLTLQEGVSEPQFKLISNAGIRLVVPEKRIEKYATSIRPHIVSVESFLADVRTA